MKIYENLKNETIDPGEGVRRLLIRPLLYPEGIFFSCRRNCLVEPPKCEESCPESKPIWAMLKCVVSIATHVILNNWG